LSLAPGQMLSQYRLVDKIGAGGMGEVWRAEDTVLHRTVAIKVLPSALADDAERLARFQQEARAVSALNHPNLVTLFEVGTHEGVSYMVMELVEGETLRDKMGRSQAATSGAGTAAGTGGDTGPGWSGSSGTPRSKLPVRRAMDIAIQMAHGLAAAHERNIVHRDLKPENIVITRDGRVKILDFGIAKLLEPTNDSITMAQTVAGGTEPGTVMGTVGYMSPEQVRGAEVDHRSDIFSLGVILYEMLSGQRAFRAATSVETMNAILHDDPPTLMTGPHLSPAIDRLVRRCLEKEKEQRFQSSHDLAYALEAVKDTSGAMPLPESSVSGSGASTRRGLVRSLLLTLLTLVIGAAVGRTLLSNHERAQASDARVARQSRMVPLTFESGPEGQPSVSPDGRFFVYIALDGGDWDIFQQRVGGENRINLTADSPEHDWAPQFSSDGEHIAFRSQRDGGGIFIMGATGESVRRLTDFGFNPKWSPDDRSIVFGEEDVPSPLNRNLVSALWVADVGSGETHKIYEGDGVEPSWSPDGRTIAFWGLPRGTGKRILYTMPATGGTPQPLNDDDYFNWNPAWSSDGRTLYFASTRGGTMDLWSMPMDPATGLAIGAPQPLTMGSGENAGASVTRDGSKILFSSYRAQSVIRRLAVDLANPDSARVVVPEMILRTSRDFWEVRPSPDGRLLVIKVADPDEDLFVCHTDGSGLRRLTQDSFKDRNPRWGPDSQVIYFHSDRSGRYEIWSIRADGSGLTQVTDLTGQHVVTPYPSPDGNRLLVFSHQEGAGIIDLTSGLPVKQVQWLAIPDSSLVLRSRIWTPDGESFLLSTGRTGPRRTGPLLRYSLRKQSYEMLPATPNIRGWLVPGQSLLCREDNRYLSHDLETGEERTLFHVNESQELMDDPSSDGKWIYVLDLEGESDIWMLEFEEPGDTP